ncbi:virulence factor [Sagittula sp. MA-2]|uniref:virulence factor n=1 Tax=Sagittula sp. MA-2 TaxID=3048007 RepID=UPI0024C31B20|nr:virulence factor [Sagittula sp. MA-2]WHZ37469.1 virulence factor [Sagittula sp. MA-2]
MSTELTIVYWRDIPAQVIVGKGRRGAKAQLPERFEQAIDRAAMKSGAAETDAYLAEWRKVPSGEVAGDPQEAAAEAAARLDAEYDSERLKTLIANGGWADVSAQAENQA